MANVKIPIEEYNRLIKIEDAYYILLSAIDDAMVVKVANWRGNEPYVEFDDSGIENVLRLIERDDFESIFQRKLAEVEAKKAEEEEDVSE